MEDSKTAAATQVEGGTSAERKVIDGKRMVRRKLSMETVQRMLSISPKPVPTGPVINPMFLDSRKRLMKILEFVRQRQEAMREELRTKGYVMGWVTDDDED